MYVGMGMRPLTFQVDPTVFSCQFYGECSVHSSRDDVRDFDQTPSGEMRERGGEGGEGPWVVEPTYLA